MMDIEGLGHYPVDRALIHASHVRGAQNNDVLQRRLVGSMKKVEDSKSIDARHGRVQDDDGVIGPREFSDCLETVASSVHEEPAAVQYADDHGAQDCIVFHDQYIWSYLSHRFSPLGSLLPRASQMPSQVIENKRQVFWVVYLVWDGVSVILE
jgi:hypothetical protein